MLATRMQGAIALRRGIAVFALLAAALALAACRSYVFLPVDVAYEKFSPPYVVSFVNQTGAPFEVLPTRYGEESGQPRINVPAGGSFRAVLQLRRFTVGRESSAPGVQVVASPYFEQAGPDKAQVAFYQAEERRLLVMLQDPSWFVEYERPDAAPIELLVPLRDLSLVSLFPRGPRAAP